MGSARAINPRLEALVIGEEMLQLFRALNEGEGRNSTKSKPRKSYLELLKTWNLLQIRWWVVEIIKRNKKGSIQSILSGSEHTQAAKKGETWLFSKLSNLYCNVSM